MERECPFWAQQRMCNNNKCSICECGDNSIPYYWKEQVRSDESDMQGLSHKLVDFNSFGNNAKKPVVSNEQQKNFRKSGQWCEAVDENTEDGEYIFVNLQENKESYTAYNGSNVWLTIYQENCLLEEIKRKGFDPTEQCSDETLLYQAVSGLHASVNIHISHNYHDSETNQTYPNHTMYLEKIGAHRDRLRNLHMVYALVVRAINRIDAQLVEHDYTTGLCSVKDAETHVHVRELLSKTIAQCDTSFNETAFFHDNDDSSNNLLNEIQNKFFNISRIFDCIGCDKCRFNGKVQITGLGTAMKVLFSSDQEINANPLTKTEIISIINLLGKLSESIAIYEEFLIMEQNQKFNSQVYKHLGAYFGICGTFAIFKVLEHLKKVKQE